MNMNNVRNSQVTDLSKIETRIVELCEQAKARGWRFAGLDPCHEPGVLFGPALYACAFALGMVKNNGRFDFVRAGREIGLPTRRQCIQLNDGFDAQFEKEECEDDPDDEFKFCLNKFEFCLGARLARRFMEQVECTRTTERENRQ